MGRYLLGWVMTLAFVALGFYSRSVPPPAHAGAPPTRAVAQVVADARSPTP